ncbi:MAG: hypothetical protein AB1603_06990 [Chloroflexota bacterium]
MTTKDELARLLFSEGRHIDAGPVLTWATLDSQTLLEGKVELVMPATVELKLVSSLFDYLQATVDLKVLYTKGSWDGSATIAVVLEKALPLLDIISKMPGIEASAELSGDAPQARGDQPLTSDKAGTGARKVRLHLKAT